jgi:hypothetical protein
MANYNDFTTGSVVATLAVSPTPTTLTDINFDPITGLARITTPYSPHNYTLLGLISAIEAARPVYRLDTGQLYPRLNK